MSEACIKQEAALRSGGCETLEYYEGDITRSTYNIATVIAKPEEEMAEQELIDWGQDLMET